MDFYLYLFLVRDECSADDENPYYGNDGALKCLNEGGDVAILELQSLKGNLRIFFKFLN